MGRICHWRNDWDGCKECVSVPDAEIQVYVGQCSETRHMFVDQVVISTSGEGAILSLRHPQNCMTPVLPPLGSSRGLPQLFSMPCDGSPEQEFSIVRRGTAQHKDRNPRATLDFFDTRLLHSGQIQWGVNQSECVTVLGHDVYLSPCKGGSDAPPEASQRFVAPYQPSPIMFHWDQTPLLMKINQTLRGFMLLLYCLRLLNLAYSPERMSKFRESLTQVWVAFRKHWLKKNLTQHERVRAARIAALLGRRNPEMRKAVFIVALHCCGLIVATDFGEGTFSDTLWVTQVHKMQNPYSVVALAVFPVCVAGAMSKPAHSFFWLIVLKCVILVASLASLSLQANEAATTEFWVSFCRNSNTVGLGVMGTRPYVMFMVLMEVGLYAVLAIKEVSVEKLMITAFVEELEHRAVYIVSIIILNIVFMVAISTSAYFYQKEQLTLVESRNSELCAKRLLHGVCDAVVRLDSSWHIDEECPSFEAMMMLSPDGVQLQGKHIVDLACPDDRQRFEKFLRDQLILQGSTSLAPSIRVTFMSKQSARVPLEVFGSCVELHPLFHRYYLGMKDAGENEKAAVSDLAPAGVEGDLALVLSPTWESDMNETFIWVNTAGPGLPLLACSPGFAALCTSVPQAGNILNWMPQKDVPRFLKWLYPDEGEESRDVVKIKMMVNSSQRMFISAKCQRAPELPLPDALQERSEGKRQKPLCLRFFETSSTRLTVMEKPPCATDSSSDSGSSSDGENTDRVLLWISAPHNRIAEVYGECPWMPSNFLVGSFWKAPLESKSATTLVVEQADGVVRLELHGKVQRLGERDLPDGRTHQVLVKVTKPGGENKSRSHHRSRRTSNVSSGTSL